MNPFVLWGQSLNLSGGRGSQLMGRPSRRAHPQLSKGVGVMGWRVQGRFLLLPSMVQGPFYAPSGESKEATYPLYPLWLAIKRPT